MIKRELNSRRNKKGQSSKDSAKHKETFDEKTIKYLQTIISLIEGQPVSQKEILSMLAKKMRQHRMAKRKKVKYTSIYYQIRPP